MWFHSVFQIAGKLRRLYHGNIPTLCYVEHLKDGRYLSKALETMKKDPIRCKSELALLLNHHIQLFSDALQKHRKAESPALAMKCFIEENLNHTLSIDEIAACAHLSRSRANYVFKREYQVSPYRYYLYLRLEVSMNLLRQTPMTIQEISNHLGFSDYHHFSAFFKKWCGMSPTQYRSANSRRRQSSP